MALIPVPGKPGKFFDTDKQEMLNLQLTTERDVRDTEQQASGLMTAGTTIDFYRTLTNKQKMDANFPASGKIVNGAGSFMIEYLGVELPSTNGSTRIGIADLQAAANGLHLRYEINGKLVADGPILQYPSGYGMAGQTTENNQTIANIGVPSTATVRKWGQEQQQLVTDEHNIDANVTWHNRSWITSYTFPTLTARILIRLYTHGLDAAPATNN